jgi:hypothetical protein
MLFKKKIILKNKTDSAWALKIIHTPCGYALAIRFGEPLLLLYYCHAPSASTRRLHTDEVILADVQRALSWQIR